MNNESYFKELQRRPRRIRVEEDEDDDDMLSMMLSGRRMLSAHAPVISIRGVITDKTAADFRSAVDALRFERHSEVGLIRINSTGGSVYAAMEMLNIMSESDIRWLTYNESHAFSAGALLLSKGEHGGRFMAPMSRAMIHGLSAGIGFQGIEELRTEVQDLDHTNGLLLEEIAKNCGITVGKLKKAVADSGSRNLFLNAQEAKTLGLIDEIGVVSLEPVNGFQLKFTPAKELKRSGKKDACNGACKH